MSDATNNQVIAGAGGVFGGSRQQTVRTPYTAPDTLNSSATVEVVDLIGEGEIEGFATPAKAGFTRGSAEWNIALLKDIYLNNTPILRQNASNTAPTPGDYNFKNVTVIPRYGTQSQGSLSTWLPNAAASSEVSVGVEVTQAVPVVRSITNTNVDAVRVTISIPQLQAFEDSGDIGGQDVHVAIDLRYNGGAYIQQVSEVIRGRTSDLYQRDFVVPIAGAFPVDVRVRRVNPDSTNPKIVNAFSWASYTQIISDRLSYPNSALVGLKASAEQFSSIPSRAFRVRGLKVRIPSNGTVDRATGAIIYSGTWNGTFKAAEWTSDPAWCLWNLLTSRRYGFGDYILTDAEKASFNGNASKLDKWAFYEASVYCSALNTRPSGTTNDYSATGRHGIPDGFGNFEPRFSLNCNIQTAEEAFKLINDLCSVFRTMPYWSTGAMTIAQDKPVSSSYLFTLANVSEDGFTYSGSDSRTRPTVAKVSYLDLNTRDIAYEVVEDRAAIAKYGVQIAELSAFACTSRGQAGRLGEWLLYSNQYESEVISFTASVTAGVLVRPGQVIEVADPARAGARRGGRIVSATTTAVTVDNADGLPSSGGTLSVVLKNGTVETKNVTTRSGSTINVSSAFTTAPGANSVWIYNGGGISTSLWRVLSIQEQEGSNYAITALSYNPTKYTYIERGRGLQQRDVTNLNIIPEAPTNLTLTEALYRYQSEVRAKVIITWRQVRNVNQYRVRWRKNNANWNEYITQSPDHEILNITPGTFEVEVYSLNSLQQYSNVALTGSINALGKTAPPSNVTGLTNTIDPKLGVALSWTPVTDLDLKDYEIRVGSGSWDNAVFLAYANTTRYVLGLLDPATTTYWVKARDTSNVLSATAASTTVTITAAAAPTVTHAIEDPVAAISWTTPRGSYTPDFYELRYGASYAAGTSVAKVYGNSFNVPVTWSGARTFWVAAVDPAGNTGTAGSRVVTINAAPAPSVSANFYGRTCSLSWNAVNGTLRTAYYEIRQGSTWDGATVVAKIQADGTGYSIDADWTGSRTFWVAALDANGNYGNRGSVVATVTQAPSLAPVATIVNRDVRIRWSQIKGTLEIAYYEVRQGDDYATAEVIGRVNATVFTTRITWSGTRRFWIVGVDTNGLYGAGGFGTEASVDVVVQPPTQPAPTQQVVDNNVLLRWTDCKTTLPVESYELRRGATWETATVIGTKSGLFTSVFETAGGTYTYWLAAIDTAGTYSTPGSVAAVVNQPPDYVLRLNQNSTFSGTRTSAVAEDGTLVLGVNTTETYQQHFTTRSWNTPQDQINAGFSRWIMPSTTTAAYEETIDYGSLLPASKITMTLTSTVVAGSVSITPQISVRALTSDPWTDYAGVSEVYGTNFRYVKFRYDFASAGGNDLARFTALNFRLDSKLRNDAGNGTARAPQSGTYSRTGTTITVTATAHGMTAGRLVDLDFTSGAAVDGVYTIVSATTDTFTVTSAASGTTSGNVTLHSGGTVVSFAVPFVDVESISVTPSGTAARIAIYDFQDVPNPTTFKVLLFDTAGTRVTGGFSWSARGV